LFALSISIRAFSFDLLTKRKKFFNQRRKKMRFMMLVKANNDFEAGAPFNPELMAAIAKRADEATSEESFRSDRRICFNPGHAAEIVGEASRKIEQRPPIVPALIRQGKRAPNSHSSLIDQRRQQFIEECSA